LLLSLPAVAASGNDWLISQLNQDGSISAVADIATPYQATAEALRVKAVWEVLAVPGVDYLAAELVVSQALISDHLDEQDTEQLARFIIAADATGFSVINILAELSLRQNGDGGFGHRRGYASTVLDTAFVLEALALVDSSLNSPDSSMAVAYLYDQQRNTGGWSDGANEASVYVSAQVMRALLYFRDIYTVIPEVLTAGQNFLLSRRGAGDGWAAVYETALSMLVILPQLQDTSLLSGSAELLRQQQQANGSWGDDVYSTALAIQAIYTYEIMVNQANRTAPLSGYVVKAITGEAIADADVFIQSGAGHAVKSNGDGYYMFPTLAAADYTVVASKPGYLPASIAISSEAGKTNLAGNLVLAVAPQQGLVAGSIFAAADKQMLAGVSIMLAGANIYRQTTDSRGQFDLGAVEPGSYSLLINKDGYSSVTGTVSIAAGQLLTINQGLGIEGGYLENQPADIYGRVIDASTGLGLAGVSVDLGGGLMTGTDGNGEFRLFAVARGNYTAIINIDNYQAAHYSLVFPAGASGDLGVLSLYPIKDEVAPETLTLTGMVIDGISQAPLAGASITIPELSLVTTTNADGRFTLGYIKQTRFSLLINAGGYNNGEFLIQADAFGQMNARFSLSPPGDGAASTTLSGVVTGQSDGLPIANARIQIEGSGLSTLTDLDGKYSLSGVADLMFTLSVSAVGYVSQIRSMELTAFGHYTFEPILSPIAINDFQVLAVNAPGAPWAAATTVMFAAEIANVSMQAREILVMGEVVNAAGTTVAIVSAFQPDSAVTGSHFSFQAGENKTLTFPWYSAQFSPGSYTLVVRVIEPQTITQINPRGVVLAEGSGSGQLQAMALINGIIALDPPVTQAGSKTPVALKALIRNAGNIQLDNSSYQMIIRNPDDSEILYMSEEADLSLAVGQFAEVDFGQWLPTRFGNLSVTVSALGGDIQGMISSTLYVGDSASGHFSLDRSIVPEGDQTVRGRIDLSGVDVASGVSTDPLFALVRDSAERANAYVSRESVAWHKRNRCLGCHIQAQSLMGIKAAQNKIDIDQTTLQFLLNALETAQQENGDICDRSCNTHEAKLGIWALSSGTLASATELDFKVLYQAVIAELDRKLQAGNQVYWGRYGEGWLDNADSVTMNMSRGMGRLLSLVEYWPELQADKLVMAEQRFWAGPTAGPKDIEFGTDGHLYMVKKNDFGGNWWDPSKILRKDFSTGSIAEVASLDYTSARGLAVGEDGTLFVTTLNNGLLRINNDGTQDVLLEPRQFPLEVGSSLFDVELGPDDMLYISDAGLHQIIRINQSGQQVEVLTRDGLLNSPKGLAFNNDGQLLIANHNGYNILQLLPDDSLSVFSDGLYHRPEWLDVNDQQQVFVSNNYSSPLFVYRIQADGRAESIYLDDADWVNSIKGVAVDPQTNQVYLGSYYGNHIHTLTRQPFDNSRLAEVRESMPGIARYFLSREQYYTPGNYWYAHAQNHVLASMLMGLGEVRPWVDSGLQMAIDLAINKLIIQLGERQHADGGWGKAATDSSDPLITAMVGLALEYSQPSADDPVIRKVIEYLLGSQAEDGSWYNVNNGFTMRLAASSFVLAYLPQAMERLGGIDIDLHIITPHDVQLHNPSINLDSLTIDDVNNSHSVWSRQGVTGSGQSLYFDLLLSDMRLNEERPVASEAWLTFKNSFTDETLRIDLDVPAVTARSGVFLMLATDQAMYQANEMVQITAQISNTSPVPATALLALAIHSRGSNTELASLPEVAITDHASGEQLNLASSWFTDGTFNGEFDVVGRLVDENGRVLDESRVAFTIEAPEILANLALSSGKTHYNPWDIVTLTSQADNATGNVLMSDSLIELNVTDSEDNSIFYATRRIGSLAPGASAQQFFNLSLTDANAGSYSVTAILRDEFTRQILARGTARFVVERDVLQGLIGKVAVSAPSVYIGEVLSCIDTITNISTVAFNNLELSYQWVNIDTGTIISTSSLILENLPGGDSHWSGRDIESSELGLGGYACVIKAYLDGKEQMLAYNSFQVVEPPIRIAANLSIGNKGRVLVLVDAETKACMPQCGQEAMLLGAAENLHANNVSDQYSTTQHYAALEQLMGIDGWSYHVSDNAGDFSTELRSGAYSHFVILSSRVVLSDMDQRLLRELVFNGAGLMVARGHDQRNARLHTWSGVKSTGVVSAVDGIIVTSADLGESETLLFPLPEKISRIAVSDAEVLARFVLSDDSEAVAIARTRYGHGQVVYVAFDLLQQLEAALQGEYSQSWLWSFSKLIGLSHPQQLVIAPGRVVPVSIALLNEGVATMGKVVVEVGTAVSVIDSISTDGSVLVTEDGHIEWPFSLSENELKRLTLWLRMAVNPDSVTISSQTQVGDGSQYTDFDDILGLVVSIERAPEVIELIDAARRLPLPTSKKLANFLEKVSDALIQQDYHLAMQFLLQTVEFLAVVPGAEAEALRHQCIDLLQMQMQDFPG
jgi:hypothetical protein